MTKEKQETFVEGMKMRRWVMAAFMLSVLTACSSQRGDLEDFARCGRVAHMLGQYQAFDAIAKNMDVYAIENKVNMSQFDLARLFEEVRNELDRTSPRSLISLYNSSTCVKLHGQDKIKFQDVFG